jgi:phospholipid N-methyltransferase
MNPPQEAIPERTRPDLSQDGRGPDWWLVITKLFTQGTGVAMLTPSSRFLARSICKGIDYDRAKCIVELGAGTGPVTKELLKRVKPHTRLVVVERDADFCARLRKLFPDADVAHADARDLDRILDERGIKYADHVVSGLPLPSFPAELRDEVVSACARRLDPDGTFRQLTVMPYVYRGMYRSYFDDVRFRLVPLNVPPGGVYVCKGYRARA